MKRILIACLLFCFQSLPTLAQSRVDFAYDAAGNRVKKKLTGCRVWNPSQIMSKKINALLACIILVIAQSCVPMICSKNEVVFRNKTQDTLLIGVSQYDCIDSIGLYAYPNYVIKDNRDTVIKNLKGDMYLTRRDFIYPDSLCAIDSSYLVSNHNACYFFLVKLNNAKENSWSELKSRNLYYRKIVRWKNGKFNKNISYSPAIDENDGLK